MKKKWKRERKLKLCGHHLQFFSLLCEICSLYKKFHSLFTIILFYFIRVLERKKNESTMMNVIIMNWGWIPQRFFKWKSTKTKHRAKKIIRWLEKWDFLFTSSSLYSSSSSSSLFAAYKNVLTSYFDLHLG